MMESLPGFKFHIPTAIKNTATTMTTDVKPISANGMWKFGSYNGAKPRGFSYFKDSTSSQELVSSFS